MARTPSARFEGAGFVADRSLQFHKQGQDGSGKCNILAGGPGVYVAVYTIAAVEKPVLDRIEHAGIGYEVSAIDVPGFGECFTYVATETHIVPDLAPYCWYHELVVQGCRFHRLPAAYLDEVNGFSRLRDPDYDRRRRNWQLVESMRRS